MSNEDRIHVVMRFADGFLSAEDTIARHLEVIERHGAVWIGKLGKALGDNWIAIANEQCRRGEATYLLLVQKSGSSYEAHRGRVLEITKQLPSDGAKLVPKYYHENSITRQVSFWVKLASLVKVKQGGLMEYRIASSGRPLPSTLRKSMAALFVVKEGRGIDY